MSIYLHLGSPSRNILFANFTKEVTGYGQVNAWGNGYFTNEWLNAGSATGFASSTFDGPASSPFSFDDLPMGFSWTSDSGTLFSALATPPVPGGAVPEPATWAMMTLGFDATGGTMRYRRRRTRVNFA